MVWLCDCVMTWWLCGVYCVLCTVWCVTTWRHDDTTRVCSVRSGGDIEVYIGECMTITVHDSIISPYKTSLTSTLYTPRSYIQIQIHTSRQVHPTLNTSTAPISRLAWLAHKRIQYKLTTFSDYPINYPPALATYGTKYGEEDCTVYLYCVPVSLLMVSPHWMVFI